LGSAGSVGKRALRKLGWDSAHVRVSPARPTTGAALMWNQQDVGSTSVRVEGTCYIQRGGAPLPRAYRATTAAATAMTDARTDTTAADGDVVGGVAPGAVDGAALVTAPGAAVESRAGASVTRRVSLETVL
jgi:hypothetical protein